MSLSQSAVLVKFGFEKPSFTKKAVDLARDAARANHADDKMFTMIERLLDPAATSKLSQWEAKARKYYRDHSVPFSDKGERLLGATYAAKFKTDMDNIIDEGEALIVEFMNDYATFVNDARALKGLRFDINDYPDVARVAKRFKVTFYFLSAPDVGTLPTMLQGILDNSVGNEVDARIKQGKREILGRLLEPIEHMADKLSNYTGGRKGAFHPTIVTNITDILDVADALNVDNDPKTAALFDAVRTMLCSYDDKTLRENAEAREETAEAAKVLIEVIKREDEKILEAVNDFI